MKKRIALSMLLVIVLVIGSCLTYYFYVLNQWETSNQKGMEVLCRKPHPK